MCLTTRALTLVGTHHQLLEAKTMVRVEGVIPIIPMCYQVDMSVFIARNMVILWLNVELWRRKMLLEA